MSKSRDAVELNSKYEEVVELDMECIKLCAEGIVGQNYDAEEVMSICSIECNDN